MSVLVIGGTGTVGSRVVHALAARGERIRVLTRSAEKAKSLPEGVEVATGDLLDPGTVRSVFTGAKGVFLLNPVSTTESHEGLMAVCGARMAGVGRIVYLSIHRVDQAPYLPHLGSKVGIESAIRASGIPYTILRSNNFFQNDYWYKDALLGYGVYPQPIGDVGMSRVDVRDIAEVAALALTSDGHAGKTYNLVGPRAHTGQTTAEVWSKALGREIRYGGNDLDAWERQSLAYLPAWMVFDFRLMYAFFQEKGFQAAPEDVESLTRVLGHAPRSFEDFAAETAKTWTASST
jgi:uncharacterized protein YbjT (DUF2867 family)